MIRIGIDPNIVTIGPFTLSWLGFLVFVAVATAVVLVARWARREGIESDTVYAVAVWAVIGGIVGARVIHVMDRWDFYGQNPGQLFAVWRGGIALFGAVLFGFVGGAAYIWSRQLLGRIYSGQTLPWLRRPLSVVGAIVAWPLQLLWSALRGQKILPFRGMSVHIVEGYLKGSMYARFKDFSVGRLADVTAPAMLIAQTIGRVACTMIGDHPSTRTDLPWGFVYSHPDSLSNQTWGLLATHPVTVYEMLWNMVVLAVIWKLRGRLAPPGMLFALYLMLYSLGRFFIQFLRLDKVWFAGLQEAHIIALIVLAITVPLLAYRARWVKREVAPSARQRPGASRASR